MRNYLCLILHPRADHFGLVPSLQILRIEIVHQS